jgi:RNA polymerase sigma-70 factor (ECF subfamily)
MVMPRMSSATPASTTEAAMSGAGDFRTVFEANARFVWRSLLGLGVAEADVPDASQHVFLVLNQKMHQLEAGCSIRTFAYGICLRVAADFRNRAYIRREQLCADLPDRALTASQEGILTQREALRKLHAALEQIDPAQREVFVLYEIEELDMAEVAHAVGCPLQTAYSRLHAARKRVAAALGEELREP